MSDGDPIVTAATHAAALTAWAVLDQPSRLALRRHPRFIKALEVLHEVPGMVGRLSADAAESSYRAASSEAFAAMPTALLSRPTESPEPDAVTLAREATPFGWERLKDRTDDAARDLERAALASDPPRAIAAWLADHGPRLERAAELIIGDHAAAAADQARLDLIDPRFRDEG